MKSVSTFIITGLLTAFGLLTTFLTSSVILDLFNIRELEGNYVLFVVWANLVSGICFLTAAFAFFKKKSWAAMPLMFSLGVLIAAFLGLMVHVNAGGAYETKTIGAMIFRIAVNTLFAALIYFRTRRKSDTAHIVKNSLALLLPLTLLVAGCGQSEKAHDHGTEAEAADHHHADEGGTLQLNNGEKWEADAHTRALVAEMKQTVSSYEVNPEDHHVLSDSLTSQLNRLIVGCTMTGPAHDELHKWLVPLTHNIKGLSTTSSASEASDNVHEIDASLHAFDDFFE